MGTIIVAFLQYALPAILTAVETHQKANGGAMPTPAQVIASPEVSTLAMEKAILDQGAAWRTEHPAPGEPSHG